MLNSNPVRQPQRHLAEAVREACIQAALKGYERALISGLCREGAWEAAVSAIRMVDLDAMIDPLYTRSESYAGCD